jgi:hypothetical protein
MSAILVQSSDKESHTLRCKSLGDFLEDCCGLLDSGRDGGGFRVNSPLFVTLFGFSLLKSPRDLDWLELGPGGFFTGDDDPALLVEGGTLISDKREAESVLDESAVFLGIPAGFLGIESSDFFGFVSCFLFSVFLDLLSLVRSSTFLSLPKRRFFTLSAAALPFGFSVGLSNTISFSSPSLSSMTRLLLDLVLRFGTSLAFRLRPTSASSLLFMIALQVSAT